MSTWLTAWQNRENREPTGPVMELLVVAGADAGSQFTLEGNEVLLGRGQPSSGQTDVIRGSTTRASPASRPGFVATQRAPQSSIFRPPRIKLS